MPEASYVMTQTRYVLVRLDHLVPSNITNLTTTFITVAGASSGTHPGTTHVAADGKTVIFDMTPGFTTGEIVTVSLTPELAPGVTWNGGSFQYPFRVNDLMPGALPLRAQATATPYQRPPLPDLEESDVRPPAEAAGSAAASRIMPNGVSVPSDFPVVNVNVNNDSTSGNVFLSNGLHGTTPGYTMILDSSGLPVWYRRGHVFNFEMQNNGTITWCDGVEHQNNGFQVFDQDFNLVGNYHPVNGYLADIHELEVLEDGTYFMLGRRVHTVDLSKYYSGGSPTASVYTGAIQEFTPAGELIFQWRPWDHLADEIWISGSNFPHMNALDVDADGNLLLSSRHIDEITKIDRHSGEIIWRLGGILNDFQFVNDPLCQPMWYGVSNAISYQHNITALGNNRYLLFDNGNERTPPRRVSRAVEYELDLTNRTATLVWEFRDTPDKYSYRMGNAQRLPNGDTLINFVQPAYPAAIQVSPPGVRQFELTLNPKAEQYRVLRYPWEGVVAVPYLVVEPETDHVRLMFNKFGDDTVDHYRIYGGTSAAPTRLVATTASTRKQLTNVVNGVVNYWRVTAVSTNGVESGFSNEEDLLVNITLPGDNMVVNGEFSEGSNGWHWVVIPPASAVLDVSEQNGHSLIAGGGTYISDVQLSQAGMSLIQGREYSLEFDAWSAAPRLFEAKVEENNSNGMNYSGIQPFTITPVVTHYSYLFKMNRPSDNDARVTFNSGAFPYDVYVDNVSLVERVYAPGDFNHDGCVGLEDLQILTSQWQEEQDGLTADLNGDGTVDFQDFDIFSEAWSGDGKCP